MTWAERVDLRTGRPVEVAGSRYEEKEVIMWPSPFGAHSWHPMSFSPKTGLVYHVHCSHCHGLGAISGGVVPDLRYSNEPTRMLFHDIVLKGTLLSKGMPNMGDRLTAADVDAIKAYVGTRAQEDYAKQQSGGTR